MSSVLERKIAELARVRDQNYAENGYVPVERAYQSREGRGEEGYNVKQLQKTIKKKKEKKLRQDEISILEHDIFNLSSGEIKKGWAELEVAVRVQLMEDFLSTADRGYGDQVVSELIKMTQKGLLKRKSDVTYDPNNEKIVDIHVVGFNEEENRYFVNLDQKRRREIQRKKLRKMMRE